MMDTNGQINALLTEHLRYTPLTLIDDVINAVNTIMYRGIEAIENGLLQIPPQTLGYQSPKTYETEDSEYSEAQDEIENGVHQLETLLEATVDKAFDRFELWTLRNILTVPEDLVPFFKLAHHDSVAFPFNPSVSPTPDTISSLRNQLHESRKLNTALQAQYDRNAALLDELRAIQAPPPPSAQLSKSVPSALSAPISHSNAKPAPSNSLSFLVHPPHPTGSPSTGSSKADLPLSFSTTANRHANPVTEHARFAASHLPALSSLVNNLRPCLQDLRTKDAVADAAMDTDENEEGKDAQSASAAVQRQRYVEGSAARAVDTIFTKGQRSGTFMTREQDGQARIGVEEVVQLEKVVHALTAAR